VTAARAGVGAFDPAGAVTFDLGRGRVGLEGDGASLLVPAAALSALAAAAGPDAAAAFGAATGRAMGLRVATRLGGAGDLGPVAVRSTSLDVVVGEIGGELAIAGLGSLELERWGRALVLCVDGSPLGGDGDALLEAALAAALEAASGREARVVRLERQGARARLLVTGAGAAPRVRAWLAEGVAWADAIARLHAGPAAAAPAGGSRES
jgi:hypothetical protein